MISTHTKEDTKTLSKGSAREQSEAGERPTGNNCQLELDGAEGGPRAREVLGQKKNYYNNTTKSTKDKKELLAAKRVKNDRVSQKSESEREKGTEMDE